MKAVLLFALLAQEPAEPARVVVEPAEVELEVGESRRLEAVAYDEEGNRLRGLETVWFVADEEVARVDGAGALTALRPGRTPVAAVVAGVPGFGTITVAQLPPAAVRLEVPERLLAGAWAPIHAAAVTRLGDPLPEVAVRYESDAPEVAWVDATGRLVASRPGEATLVARAAEVSASVRVRVVENPAAAYEVLPGSPKVRTGDVVRFRVRAATAGDEEVAGLFPLWAVGRPGARIEAEGEEGVFVAEEPGRYPVTAAVGPGIVRTAAVEVEPRGHDAGLMLVGRGPIDAHRSGDMWVFEGADGRDYVYIGTFMHDWMKVWDVTDPSRPVLTDSVQVDARRINDVKIHPNARVGVITREGASDRRNGIVLLDLSDPAHPTILSEYTETLTGGVHNVWIRGEEDLVYACHNGTGDLHIIDISDPRGPREVGRWGLDKRFKTLHDVIVQDGYAYLSYWHDGLVILDAGAGSHGGTPTEPVLVSQYRYPIGHTHVAWRHGRYVFVGDEVFPADWDPEARPGPIEARGYVHVLDVSDLENPVEVGRYEVPEAGAHNVWVEGDRLYVGYYQAGLRAVDISGELRGDLYRQGRELAALKTTDEATVVPNWPMTWGAQLHKGNIYSSDLNSGLWITRLVEH